MQQEVIDFAERMQMKLDKNERKPCDVMKVGKNKRTWKHCDVFWLLRRLREETIELEIALCGKEQNPRAMDEAADVGNFAMMIHDVISTRYEP